VFVLPAASIAAGFCFCAGHVRQPEGESPFDVLDRIIQPAGMQVLQRRCDRTFCEHSYGFRRGRSAHQAVEAASFHEAGVWKAGW
jgi:hypothetical protein